MRVENTIRNSLYSVISYAVLGVLVLSVRKAFVSNLPIDFLGFEGLFGNIFALLAMADLGIETVVLYRLMPAFVNDDKKEICKLFSIYKYVYKIISLAILILGIAIMPFIKYIVKTDFTDWNYIYTVYILQLIIVACSYWLGYVRIIFFVTQNDYKCVKVDTVVSIIANTGRVFFLIMFHSYILYLLCNIAQSIISNWIISRKAYSEHSYLKNIDNVNWEEIKKIGLKNDIKYNLVQKTCGTIYGGTDNILISVICGVKYVGLYSNYLLLINFLTNFLVKLLRPFQASIGNFIYSESEARGYRLFRMFDMLSYFIASFVCLSFYNCSNPFLEIWLGNEFTFSSSIIFAIILNQYVMWNHQFLTFYRYSFGNYEL